MSTISEFIFGSRQRTIIKYKISSNANFVFEIDTTVSETHNKTTSITRHEIESGATITDHVIKNPVQVQLSGIISDFPLRVFDLGNLNPLNFNNTKPSVSAYNLFKEIYEEQRLVTIETKLETYDNMIITDISIPRTNENINNLQFSITAEQINFAYSELTEVDEDLYKDDVKDKAVSKKNEGKKTTKELTGKKSEFSSTFYDKLAKKKK